MTIRKANQRELAYIMSYSRQVLKEASMGHIPPTTEKASQMVQPFLRGGGYYLVYTEQDVLKGWIAVGSTISHYQDKPVGMIPELYVLPNERRQGIAAKLCCTALAQLQKAGFTMVELNVFANNPMKQFYKDIGFYDVSSLMCFSLV